MARPEPMNATPLHAKARVSLEFSDPIFVAGGFITGKMELECKTDGGLGLGTIKAELFAIQELTSRDHSATNTFLHITRYFQGPDLPPSNAVDPQLPLLEELPDDYLPARRGKTTFFFRFPLPVSSPASIQFDGGLAKLTYEVRASVGVIWRNDRQLTMERKEVRVVEALGPSDGINVDCIALGEKGKLWAQGRILNPYLVAGREACIELFVKNHTGTRTASLDLILKRQLRVSPAEQNESLLLSESWLDMPFRGPEYILNAGTEAIANLVFLIPHGFHGVRSGGMDSGEDEEGREIESLFDVQCVVEVRLGMGLGHADVVLELPVTIAHPATVKSCSSPDTNSRSILPLHSNPTYEFGRYIGHNGSFSPAYPPLIDHACPWSQSTPIQKQPSVHTYHPFCSVACISPLRASSAEPFVSRQLPALPTYTNKDNSPRPDLRMDMGQYASAYLDQPELGKGERASRISAHLRISSRNRSVSPQSHRFPAAHSALKMAFDASLMSDNTAVKELLPVMPRYAHQSPLYLEDMTRPQNSSVEILSPFPASRNQLTLANRDTMKSENVIDLERMAAAETYKKGYPVEDSMLMSVIVPTGDDTDDRPKLPPEPTLSPVAIRPHTETKNRVNGLETVELKPREEEGTSKFDSNNRVQARSRLPAPISIPTSKLHDPPTDSAISSLSLAADGPLSDSGSVSGKAHESCIPLSEHILNTIGIEGEDKFEREDMDERGKCSKTRKMRKVATGRVAAWLGGIEPGFVPSSSDMNGFDNSNFPSDAFEELFFNNSQKSDSLCHPSSPNYSCIEPSADDIPTGSSGFVLTDATNVSLSAQVADGSDSSRSKTPTPVAGVAQPFNSHIPGGLLQSKPVLKRLAERISPPLAQHDVKSARGGQGRRVTTMGALWASMTQGMNRSHLPNNKAKTDANATQAGTPRSFKKNRVLPTKSLRQDSKHHDAVRAMQLTSAHAIVVKSASVPAIISSSLAKPVLSSTASLARPLHKEYPKNIYHNGQSDEGNVENQDIKGEAIQQSLQTHNAHGEIAFGQERLKKLIKRYQ